jgi:hypothetical protein
MDEAPLSSELRHHTAYPVRSLAGSHLGLTLNPGKAVLTLGVFRRSRSVAYIRADASPSEVLAGPIVTPTNRPSQLSCQTVACDFTTWMAAIWLAFLLTWDGGHVGITRFFSVIHFP